VLNYTGKDDVDHIDQDGLNCSRDNLRIVSRTINNLNRVRGDYSGIKVRQLADGSLRYDARLQVNYQHVHLGTTRSQWTARLLVDANLARIFRDEPMIAVKRQHRWAPIRKMLVGPT
jgi:hypothetical protein